MFRRWRLDDANRLDFWVMFHDRCSKQPLSGMRVSKFYDSGKDWVRVDPEEPFNSKSLFTRPWNSYEPLKPLEFLIFSSLISIISPWGYIWSEWVFVASFILFSKWKLAFRSTLKVLIRVTSTNNYAKSPQKEQVLLFNCRFHQPCHFCWHFS